MLTNQQTHNAVTYLVGAGKLQPVEGQTTVWRDALNQARVRYEDLQEACRLLASEPGSWIGPGDLIAAVKRVRKARIGNRTAPEPPPALRDDPAAQVRWQRAYYAALGDGSDEQAADEAACAALGIERPAEIETSRPLHLQLVKTTSDVQDQETA